jgi:hypothetical protein
VAERPIAARHVPRSSNRPASSGRSVVHVGCNWGRRDACGSHEHLSLGVGGLSDRKESRHERAAAFHPALEERVAFEAKRLREQAKASRPRWPYPKSTTGRNRIPFERMAPLGRNRRSKTQSRRAFVERHRQRPPNDTTPAGLRFFASSARAEK